jgi:hypothetical protein
MLREDGPACEDGDGVAHRDGVMVGTGVGFNVGVAVGLKLIARLGCDVGLEQRASSVSEHEGADEIHSKAPQHEE